MHRKDLIFLLCIHLLAGCHSGTSDPDTGGQQMDPYEWMVGNWYVPGGNYFEEWRTDSDTSLAGMAYRVAGDDTVRLEDIWLIKQRNDLIYRTVISRNGETAVTDFKQRNASGDTLAFENPQHDYPKMIYYEKVGADSIFIYIQGTDDEGVTSRQYFSMKRAQNGRAKTD